MSNDLNLGDLGITINVSEGEPASAQFTLPDGSVVTRPFSNGELSMRLGLGLGLGYQPAVGGGASAPSNTGLPVIAGTAQSGQTLSATNGTWNDGGAEISGYAYQWKADGIAISGATASTFKLTDTQIGAVITVTVTATNAAGFTAATSAGTDEVGEGVQPHRHWRIAPTVSAGSIYSLTEVLMRSQIGGSENLAVSANGTASASGSFHSGFAADKAIDGDPATSWSKSKGGGDWWKFSFTSPQDIQEVEIRTNSGEAANHPTSFTIEYSDNDVTWTVWKTVAGLPAWTGGEWRTFNIGDNTELPRFWRFRITEYVSATYINVEGVQFRATGGGANQIVFAGGGAIGNKGAVSGTNPGMAFDGLSNIGWEATHVGTTSLLRWQQPSGVGIDVTEYLIGPGNFAGEAPKAWELQWSRDGYSWTTSDTRSAQTGWSAHAPRPFSATSTVGA